MDGPQSRPKSTIAHVFYRPGIYFGRDFATIGEFAIFVDTLGLVARESGFPEEEVAAVRGLNEFVCRHLHGDFKNTSWQDDLLAEYHEQATTIDTAKILLLRFAARLREKGLARYREVVESAPSMERPDPNRRRIDPGGVPGELASLIAEALQLHEAGR